MLPKQKQKQIAFERIEVLLEEARKISKTNMDLANRYLSLARKLSMKYKVKIPKKDKKLFCKGCYKYLLPGKTLRARMKNKKLIYYCTNCSRITRYPMTKKT